MNRVAMTEREPDKVDIFMALFRGREDVYARRWENPKKGIAGYSPVLREDPRRNGARPGKGKRKKRARPEDYEPLTKVAVVDRHLRGDDVLGVYPLLPDNTSWFLAFDFDGDRAFEEAKELVAVCELQELPVYLERSRSGNYHVWLFFEAPVEAWKARRVGFELLKEAGLVDEAENAKERAFDRMFPNQDFHSGKGLGNLIALPLQGKAVLEGRTEFLDTSNGFEPFENQWAFLKSVRRVGERPLLGIDLMADVDLAAPAPPRKGKGTGQRMRALRELLTRSDEENEAAVERLCAECVFVRHCKEEAKALPEQDWWALASNLAAFGEPGRSVFHELSKEYPGYDRAAADAKFDRQLEDPKPHTCAFIREKVWDCGRDCGVRSPCALPFKRAEDDGAPADLDAAIDAIPEGTERKELNLRLAPVLQGVALLADEMERERLLGRLKERFGLGKTALAKRVKELQVQERERKRAEEAALDREYPRVVEEEGVYLGRHGFDADGNPRYDAITDFLVRIKNTIYTLDGCVREIVLVKHGRESDKVILRPVDMAAARDFHRFCNGVGFYNFTGTNADLYHLWALLQAGDPGKLIYQSDHIGHVERDRLWLFKNAIIRPGQIVRPDSEGIFWLESKGLIPASLDSQDQTYEKVPSVELLDEAEARRVGEALIENLHRNLGGYKAYLALGWTWACCFMPEIVRRYGCFPILFLYGKRGCGKNTLAAWLLQAFGIHNEGKNIAETTHVGISRRFGYYSCLPVWFDEYRNERKVTMKDGLLRDVYNQIGASKGIQLTFGTREVAVRGAAVLSGEHLPADNGLLSRCVIVHLTAIERQDRFYDEVGRIIGQASAFTADILRRKTADVVKAVMDAIDGYYRFLRDKVQTPRLALNYAVVAGVMTWIRKDQGFIDWLETEIAHINEVKESESLVNTFIEDLDVLKANGVVTKNHYAVDVLKNRGHLYFSAAYNLWAESYRRRTGEPAWPKKTILDQLKEEAYFVASSRKSTVRIAGVPRHVVTVDLDQAPELLRSFFTEDLEATDGRDGGRRWGDD